MTTPRIAMSALAVLTAVSWWSELPAQQAPQHPDAKPLPVLLVEWRMIGPNHKTLTGRVGEWKTVSKIYAANPNEPHTAKGTAKFIALMGGRFVQQTYEREIADRHLHGMVITGYDNALKKFVSIRIDDAHNGMMQAQGTYDKNTKTMTESGTLTTPLGEAKFKLVTKSVDEDTFHVTQYSEHPDGKMTKIMESTYSRVQQ